jgi:CelD/BcsL family acetyltransferase involved in cellulose biosynthesis
MSAPRLVQLNSAADIRSAAPQWDDLWERSEVTVPVARAEFVAHWIERCMPLAKTRALAVELDGRFVAAMPLIGGRLKRFMAVGKFPCSNWSWAGDLLLDVASDVPAALDVLLTGIERVGWPLIWIEDAPFDANHWRQFIAAAKLRGLRIHTKESFRVAVIEIDHDWPGYERRLTRGLRRQMRRMGQRASKSGDAKLTVYCNPPPGEIEALLRRGFTIEDSGWKGLARSSVLKWPERFSFHLEEAVEAARIGALQISFLDVADRPIAFEYGWNCKGVYHSFKVGYDEAFSELTPGQLLRYRMLQEFFRDPKQQLVDFLGPAVPATTRWATATYPVGRVVLSTGRLSGRIMLHAYRSWWPVVQRLRRRWTRSTTANPVHPVNPV